MSEIRPFDWRDLALLHRLRHAGVCLDSQVQYTRGANALQSALLDPLLPGKFTCTLVSRPQGEEQPSAVGQFTHLDGHREAHLTFLGPLEVLSASGGQRLIEALSQSAGKRGVHHLLAEVDDGSPAYECLRRAGFAVYARQRIWALRESVGEHDPSLAASWRLEGGSDEPAIQYLYHNLVPALVQQVEPPPERNGRSLVHWNRSELLGYMVVDQGPRGLWAQPYLHPAAERMGDLLAGFLARVVAEPGKPVYLCLRSYQAGLSTALDRFGFELCNEQAVMVKRLAAPVRRPVLASLRALNGTQPEPTAPFATVVESPVQDPPAQEAC